MESKVYDTQLLARRNGCGAVLTDGRDRYRVSDWSDGTGDVYGAILKDGEWTGYAMLPRGLSLYVDIEEVYAASDHRAPAGSPAEKAILRHMRQDSGPDYGEAADPVLRARRRMRGIDGIREDLGDVIEPFRERIADIALEARDACARMVRVRLARLEDEFRRHRFTAISEHLTAYKLRIDPPLRHFSTHPVNDVDRIVHAWSGPQGPEMPFPAVAGRLREASEAISAIMIRFADEFHIDIGQVTTDEAHDAENERS